MRKILTSIVMSAILAYSSPVSAQEASVEQMIDNFYQNVENMKMVTEELKEALCPKTASICGIEFEAAHLVLIDVEVSMDYARAAASIGDVKKARRAIKSIPGKIAKHEAMLRVLIEKYHNG